MKKAEIFDGLLSALKVGDTASVIASRRDEIVKALNRDFREKDGCSDYNLMVGSFGRHTAIKGVSDLDMIYILPEGIREDYVGDSGPRRMLERVRDDLKARYPNTDIRVDQCVVRVQFAANAFKFDVQPAFENEDHSFSYPDTKSESWKTTKPRDEIRATRESVARTSANMRHLARMVRAWKNANGVVMGASSSTRWSTTSSSKRMSSTQRVAAHLIGWLATSSSSSRTSRRRTTTWPLAAVSAST